MSGSGEFFVTICVGVAIHVAMKVAEKHREKPVGCRDDIQIRSDIDEIIKIDQRYVNNVQIPVRVWNEWINYIGYSDPI